MSWKISLRKKIDSVAKRRRRKALSREAAAERSARVDDPPRRPLRARPEPTIAPGLSRPAPAILAQKMREIGFTPTERINNVQSCRNLSRIAAPDNSQGRKPLEEEA
jgi:hypothetical protein